jgi:MATE family multidrug resistance protein
VSTLSQAFAFVLHVAWCVLLIDFYDLGWFGASLALNVTYITTFVVQEFYVLVYKRSVFDRYRAPLFEEESFCDWPLYIKLAFPTSALMCIEWWAFEFIIIFAGIIGVKSLAAQVAIMNVNGFIF